MGCPCRFGGAKLWDKLRPVTPESKRIALLVDGDNAEPALLELVLAEAAKYGTVTTRRIYGNWTTPQMAGWKNTLHTHAIQPIQQFNYTSGKNATDSALIIDAMDLLHSGRVEGFCIVSSDSDFTRLATRIREHGLFVLGVGRSQTPEAFVKACDVFVHTENLSGETERTHRVSEQNGGDWIAVVERAVDTSMEDNGWAFLGAVGNALRQLDPAFDARSYGFKQLSQLIKSRPDRFVVREDKTQGRPSLVYVQMKP